MSVDGVVAAEVSLDDKRADVRYRPDLVEPDVAERVFVLLQEWLDGAVAARYGMSENDRNKILTRVLLRIIDDLQRA